MDRIRLAAAASVFLLTLPAISQNRRDGKDARPRSASQAIEAFESVRDRDERERHRAVRNLARFGDEAVTKILLAELNDATSPSYRRTVVRALGYKPRPGATPALAAAFAAAQNPRLADAVAEALRRQEEDGIAALADLLAKTRQPRSKRNAICYALGKVTTSAGAGRDAARAALLHELAGSNGRDRLPLLRGLESRQGEAAVDEVRLTLAADEDTLVAGTALAQLARHRHPETAALALRLSQRLSNKPEPRGEVHAAVLDGLLAASGAARASGGKSRGGGGEQDAAAHFDRILFHAVRADAPFAATRRSAWQPIAASDAFADHIERVSSRAKSPELRACAARALATATSTTSPAKATALARLLGDADVRVVRAAACCADLAALRAAPIRPKTAAGLAAGGAERFAKQPDWLVFAKQLAADKRAPVACAGLHALAAASTAAGAVPMSDELMALAQARMTDRNEPLRSAAILALAASRHQDAVPLLLDRLERERARLRQDVLDALHDLTDQRFVDATQWQRWWQRQLDERGGFAPAPRAPAPETASTDRRKSPQPASAAATGATYWDLPVTSERIVFVVDVSGSMAEPFGTGSGTRLEEATRQLGNVFARLPKKAKANVVTFAAHAESMFAKLQKMSRSKLKAADAYLSKLTPKGPTDVHEALERAFAHADVDTIYLLTDGRPSVGRIVDSRELAAAVRRWNIGRGLRIHTIAIGRESELLTQLARDSGGLSAVAR
ncbi:MAG: HEAT repeat domain-containing protein [Planctomycetota bacterium]